MEFQFLLNGTEFNSPINWKDLRIKYQRDSVVRGLFTTFTSELEWTGDAYAYIFQEWQTGVCTEIEAVVKYRCSEYESWEDLITGSILMTALKFDHQKCLAKAPIDQTNDIAVFIKNIDFEYDFMDAVFASGDRLYLADWFNVDTGTLIGGLAYQWGQVLIRGLFKGLVDVASNGNLNFASNYFNSTRDLNIWNLQFTATPALNETFELVMLDQFGHSHTYKVESDGTANFYVALTNTLRASNTTSPYPFLAECAYIQVNIPGGGIVYDVDLFFHWGMTFVSMSTGTGAATITETQAYQDGGYNDILTPGASADPADCYIFTPSSLGMNPGNYRISFKKFFENMSALYDLGMSFEFSGGQWNVRIEPIDYFFNSTSMITMRNIREVEKTTNNDLIHRYIYFGREDKDMDINVNDCDPYSDQRTEYQVQTVDYTCEGINDLRCEKEVYPLLGFTLSDAINGTNVDADGLYWAMRGTTLITVNRFLYDVYYITGGTIHNKHYYGVPMHREAIMYNHRNSSPSIQYYRAEYTKEYRIMSGYSVATVSNPDNTAEGYAFCPIVWSFERFVSKPDWQTILQSAQIAVNQGDDPLDDVEAFILEAEHRVFDGFTRFKLEAKS